MKKTIRPFLALLCLAMLGPILLSPILFTPGCASANRTAFQALTVTRVTVQEAMGFFNVWVGDQKAKGIDTKPTELKVKDAFEKWKTAQIALIDAAKLNSVAISTNAAGATGLSAVLENATANAAQYKADLFALLTTIGVKLPTV